jgi:hypothetical protein
MTAAFGETITVSVCRFLPWRERIDHYLTQSVRDDVIKWSMHMVPNS